MTISIHQPYALHEVGQRENNEDNIYPAKGSATASDSLLIVCDGVGGAARGEVASRLAADSFADYFKTNPPQAATDKAYWDAAFAYTQTAFDNYIKTNPMSKGMGTTLTLLHLHEEGATLVHIGDSRIYHVRGEEILFETEDHALVAQLVKQGIITPEEAVDHPRRNVITRAIQGNAYPSKIDVHSVTDIQAGDYFFLCSDGILESITNENLTTILSLDLSNEEKMGQIQKKCAAGSRDNFSAYLVQIKEIEGLVDAEYITAEELEEESKSEADLGEKPPAVESEPSKPPAPIKSKFNWLKRYGLILLFLLAGGLYFLLNSDSTPEPKPPVEQSELSQNLSRRDSILQLLQRFKQYQNVQNTDSLLAKVLTELQVPKDTNNLDSILYKHYERLSEPNQIKK